MDFGSFDSKEEHGENGGDGFVDMSDMFAMQVIFLFDTLLIVSHCSQHHILLPHPTSQSTTKLS